MTTGIERYEKVRLLGKGSFGKVWIVREKGSLVQWVMKEIRPQNKQELQEAVSPPLPGFWVFFARQVPTTAHRARRLQRKESETKVSVQDGLCYICGRNADL